MLPSEWIFGLAGVGLFVIGLRGTLLHLSMLARILAINVCGAGVFLIFVAVAYQGPTVDAVPHALVLTGIVVAVSATALALALGRRLQESGDE